MNKIKKSTLLDRIRQAVKAFQGKPTDRLILGVEVKRCDKCDRGDCETCSYKSEFDRLMSLPNCNDCKNSLSGACGFCPRVGETVRINCPLWDPREEGTEG